MANVDAPPAGRAPLIGARVLRLPKAHDRRKVKGWLPAGYWPTASWR